MNNKTTAPLSLGFTLVELLIAVTISAILFVGVLIFVSSSMRQNLVQEKMLRSLTQKGDFAEAFDRTLSNISSVIWSGSTTDGSGILVRTSLPEAPFVLIGTKSFTGLCDAYSESANASGTGYTLSLRTFLPINPAHQTAASYTITGSGYTISKGGAIIIGSGLPGNTLTSSGETTELHQASALIKHGNIVYIADTLNHRILAYDISTKNISKLLGREDGVSFPMDLAMSGSTLLIANAGNGEILSVQDGTGNRTQFSRDFKVVKPFNFNHITFEADTGSALSGLTDTGSYVFSGFTPQSSDFITSSPLGYTFSGGALLSANTGATYAIEVSDISNAPSATGSHTMRLSFYSGTTLVYQDSFPWYTLGDGDLETASGNILQVVTDGLEFPHHLSSSAWSGGITNLSDFDDTSPLQIFSSSVPISNFSYNIVNNILTLSWKEYAYYDCLTEKHLIHEQVYKQFLSN